MVTAHHQQDHFLAPADPFGMAPAEIVERILTAGYTPVIDQPKEEPWRYIGTV